MPETPFAFWTQALIDQGRKPYIAWFKSSRAGKYNFWRKYKVRIVKIVPAHWDSVNGGWLPEEENDHGRKA